MKENIKINLKLFFDKIGFWALLSIAILIAFVLIANILFVFLLILVLVPISLCLMKIYIPNESKVIWSLLSNSLSKKDKSEIDKDLVEKQINPPNDL